MSNDMLDRVRRADPLDETEVRAWAEGVDASLVLSRLGMPATAGVDGVVVPISSRRRAGRVALVAVAATAVLTTAAAATGILGGSAPESVRQHLARLDEGMPADLRLNPDVVHARAVAATGNGALYLADLAGGGYCIEVVTNGDRPRGAACVTATQLAERGVEITASIPSGDTDPLLIGGRLNDPRIDRVEVVVAEARRTPVEVGLERAWFYEVPPADRADVLRDGLVVVGLDADGDEVFTHQVPPLFDDDPTGTAFDHLQPIFLSTISETSDLTLLVGIEGSVNVAGATALELVYPDGSRVAVPLASDGTYSLMLPADRHDDFATATGALIATDANGAVLATTSVASVAQTRRGR